MSDDARWQADPEGFWRERARAIAWFEEPTTTLERHADGSWTWFPDGAINVCHLALDHHVEHGRAEQIALIWDSPVTGTVKRWTYRELRDEVAKLAGGLRALGVERGDRVVLYLPMVPEAVMAMLACARLGAVHSVVFGGFAPPELAARIDDAKPRVLLTASCGIEGSKVLPYVPLVREALAAADHAVEAVVVLEREQVPVALHDRELDWHTLVATARPADPVPVAGSDPLYVLYTSGTTG
ncbi:MAG: AMP-binding protein, partial [Alphaproteobacteria bacterium]|nr:AMP-binding protein [Alphaproteobacteria bacterium]